MRSHCPDIQRFHGNLRCAEQEGQAVFILQVINIFIKTRHQQKQRHSFPKEHLEGCCKNLHMLVVRHLVDRYKHPLAGFLYMLQHAADRCLYIGDRRLSIYLDAEAEEGQIQPRTFKQSVEIFSAAKLRCECLEKISFRIQVNDDPVIPFPEPVCGLRQKYGLAGSPHSGEHVDLIHRSLRKECL